MAFADHPHTDPGDGRTECEMCGKWVYQVIHSCKGVPVTEAAWARWHGPCECVCEDCLADRHCDRASCAQPA